MTPFGYLEGDDGTVLLQIDALATDPVPAPALTLDPDGRAILLRGAENLHLSNARPDLMRRLAWARAIHVVELDGDTIRRCYPVDLEGAPSASGHR